MSIEPTQRSAPPPPTPPSSQPAINLPWVVTLLIAANVGVFLLQVAMPWRWEGWVLMHLGFVPARYSIPGAFDWAAVAGPLTHQFLHGGWLHLLVNMIMLAAFGSGIARILGGPRLLAIYFTSGFAGAFAHWYAYPDSMVPVVGASGAISGLFGAILRMMARHPHAGGGFIRILPVVAIWIGIAVMTGFTGLPGTGGAQVAWAAHIGGFALGFIALDIFTIGRRRRPVE